MALCSPARSLRAFVNSFSGSAYSVPAVRETAIDAPEDTTLFVDALCAKRFDLVVFMTGVGASALFKEAEKRGQLQSALDALTAATTVCRGPKPVAVLRRQNVQVNITADEPHTTAEVLQALAPLDLRGKHVGLVHYGERTEAAADGLRERGAAVDEICLYEWRLPDDVAALEKLVGEIVDAHDFGIVTWLLPKRRFIASLISVISLSRTSRQSQRPWLSRLVLRAARAAPATVVAHL